MSGNSLFTYPTLLLNQHFSTYAEKQQQLTTKTTDQNPQKTTKNSTQQRQNKQKLHMSCSAYVLLVKV